MASDPSDCRRTVRTCTQSIRMCVCVCAEIHVGMCKCSALLFTNSAKPTDPHH
ncbi:hypothetical protein Scep_000412 [Stephania cephalantha]|uniref:Uncharacterized protein n=1 Tax=Stephania cephalantha TaxID=152367 RepID=A0AAP0Q6P1_9MAGN